MGEGAFAISAFADEIDPSLDVQIEHLLKNNVRAIDVRSVDGVNVLQLSDAQLRHVREKCTNAGIKIQCVGSPVNKVRFSPENRLAEIAKLKSAIDAAQILGTQRIRIFSPETGAGERDEKHWSDVLAWMRDMAELAARADVTLIHENDGTFFGAYPKNSMRLFEDVGRHNAKNFRAVFDFANTVLLGYRPMRDWFPWLLPYLDTLHIKDAVEEDGKVVPAGDGDGQMLETIRFLIEKGWNGTLTLEPHLKAGGPYGGTTGPELFEVAVKALRKVVTEAGGSC